MPFQPINFASIPAQGNPALRNFMQTLMQGYQAGQMPFQMQRQQEQEELANAFHQLRLQQEPERFQNEQTLQNLNIQGKQRELNANPNEKMEAFQRSLSELEQYPNLGNREDIKNALIRNYYGLPAQTVQEKQQAEMEAERRKFGHEKELKEFDTVQKIKAQNAKPVITGETPTKSTITSVQGIDQAINNVRPLIQELIHQDEKTGKYSFEVPNQNFLNFFSPDQQAKYKGLTSTITESLMSALNLPKTNESLETVKHIVERRWNESDKEYRERLKTLDKDLVERQKRGKKLLKESMMPNEEANVFDIEAGDFR